MSVKVTPRIVNMGNQPKKPNDVEVKEEKKKRGPRKVLTPEVERYRMRLQIAEESLPLFENELASTQEELKGLREANRVVNMDAYKDLIGQLENKKRSARFKVARLQKEINVCREALGSMTEE